MRVRVLTLNTYLCRVLGLDLAPCVPERAVLIAGVLARSQADVVALQEVWAPELREMALAGTGLDHVYAPDLRSWRRPMGAGLVLASRWPIVEAAFAPLAWTGRPKEILARRGMLNAVIDLGGDRLAVSVVIRARGGSPGRRRQHRAMLRALPQPAEAQVVCGDFNCPYAPHDPLQRETYPALAQRGFADTLEHCHGPAAATMPTVDPVNPLVKAGRALRVDRIWLRAVAGRPRVGTVEVMQQPVDGQHLSDHYAVMAELEFV